MTSARALIATLALNPFHWPKLVRGTAGRYHTSGAGPP
jgi:hypothetical protein